ncbi:hypothetical protein E4T43_01417 [Aureobasidium subglaciale]|nr:hypothetical protein E4T43_01417 [Aureobasidium subglaciale]
MSSHKLHNIGSNCFRGLVTIEVGSNKQVFSIHKDLLSFYSDYFRGAFENGFKEAIEGKMSLLDVDPEIFDIFNAFVYTRGLRNAQGLEGSKLSFSILVDLWLLGDRFIIPALQNTVIDCFKEKSDKEGIIPWNAELHTIYDNTVHGAPLRRIMIDLMVYEDDVSKKQREALLEAWPLEALVDLACNLAIALPERVDTYQLPRRMRDECYYHNHNDGERCA